jgi:aspartyl-tRNA synthetase
MDMHMIDYSLLNSALEFYQQNGFTRIEVPWTVSDSISRATKEFYAKPTRSDDGVLIGSGEQGFLDLMVNGFLPLGKYVTLTPCFRDDELDAYHRRHFMKVELIDVTPGMTHHAMIRLAEMFMLEHIPDHISLQTVATEFGYDLEYNDVELGSYGTRQYGRHSWAYGTGIAEPRFSEVFHGIS